MALIASYKVALITHIECISDLVPPLRRPGPPARAAPRPRAALLALHRRPPPLRRLRPQEPHALLQEVLQRHHWGEVRMG